MPVDLVLRLGDVELAATERAGRKRALLSRLFLQSRLLLLDRRLPRRVSISIILRKWEGCRVNKLKKRQKSTRYFSVICTCSVRGMRDECVSSLFETV